jgi:hypothetical protein
LAENPARAPCRPLSLRFVWRVMKPIMAIRASPRQSTRHSLWRGSNRVVLENIWSPLSCRTELAADETTSPRHWVFYFESPEPESVHPSPVPSDGGSGRFRRGLNPHTIFGVTRGTVGQRWLRSSARIPDGVLRQRSKPACGWSRGDRCRGASGLRSVGRPRKTYRSERFGCIVEHTGRLPRSWWPRSCLLLPTSVACPYSYRDHRIEFAIVQLSSKATNPLQTSTTTASCAQPGPAPRSRPSSQRRSAGRLAADPRVRVRTRALVQVVVPLQVVGWLRDAAHNLDRAIHLAYWLTRPVVRSAISPRSPRGAEPGPVEVLAMAGRNVRDRPGIPWPARPAGARSAAAPSADDPKWPFQSRRYWGAP